MNKWDLFSVISESKGQNKDEDFQYLLEFFVNENLHNYWIPNDANDNERKAIEIIFNDDKDIMDRIDEARLYDPYCLEAFFIELYMNEDEWNHSYFLSYYLKLSEYNNLSPYSKNSFKIILDFYIEFLIDMRNIKKAIKVQYSLINECGDNNIRNSTRLCFLYSLIEDNEAFYNYYQNNDLGNITSYILLIITLLKADEISAAQDVLNDMVSLFPSTEYIYHSWDLPEGSKEAEELLEALDSCYEEIRTMDDFFGWCKENINIGSRS